MARIKLPKKRDYHTLRAWFSEHKHLSTREISRLSGITINKIREWMIYCDSVNVADGDVFKIWVNYKNYSVAEACVVLGVTNKAFNRAMIKNNVVKYRVKPRQPNPDPIMTLPTTKEEFEKLYREHGKIKIAKMTGLSKTTVIKKINKHGLVTIRNKYTPTYNGHNNIDWLKEHYVKRKMSMRKCAKLAGVSANTIRNWLISHGIVPRPRTVKANKNATLQAGIP